MSGKVNDLKRCYVQLIPPEFTKNLVWNGIFPHKCALRGPSGLLCAAEVESTENGMFFHNGWECFVKDHHLELGDFLIFRYDGESKFSVTIYDRSACEKDVEIAKRRSGSSVSLKNTRNQARVKVEVLDDLVAESFKNINSEDETVVSDEECCNDVKLGKRPANGYLEETSDGSILFKSENSCFQRILTKHSKYHIGFPKELGVAKDLMNKTTMKLEDPTGRSWTVGLCVSKNYKQDGKVYERIDVGKGWSQVRVANKISPGDTIIFELVKRKIMKIHIVRAGRVRGKASAVKLVNPNVASSI
ncbi:hypothetical protein ACLB2K_045640 [Fragaria x ananassa]